ncbi:MAG: glycoside hydrolase family 130 protein, partial [Planctomycetota bacterium]
ERAIRQAELGFDKNLELRMLIGAYFSMEYAFESAALFNPSMVPSFDQENVSEGQGLVAPDGDVTVNPSSLYVRRLRRRENREFQKAPFVEKIHQLNCNGPQVDALMASLPDPFTHLQLQQKIEFMEHKIESATDREHFEMIEWLSHADYRIDLEEHLHVEDMVLFPISETESMGMEDMRLVTFTEDDGSFAYYGTYTAFNGRQILPQIMEVKHRDHADILTLHGKYAQNKGMALFPRRIDGRYASIGRIDGENLYMLKTDRVDFWNEAEMIQQPRHQWEFVQIGNCGSPIETDAGWLLLTHGVGAMRRYCMGAVLLDKDDPSKVIGALNEPLLSPTDEERSGYVPNVVYSCGGMVHNGNLIIPYGISDAATGFAVVELDHLLGKLT